MLKFFAPFSDAQVATVMTGKPRLTDAEKKTIEAHGMVDGVQKIFVHQRRPNLVEVFARTIKAFEGVAEATSARGDSARGGFSPVRSVETTGAPRDVAAHCGGSKKIENMLEAAAKECGGWQPSSSTGRRGAGRPAALTSQIT